jgi:glycine oxidase
VSPEAVFPSELTETMRAQPPSIQHAQADSQVALGPGVCDQGDAQGPSPGLPAAASVVVVGAGVIGLSLAFELVRREVDVLVLDRCRVGAGAAGVAAGMLAPTSEAEDENSDLVRLALESQRLYPEFVQAVEQASGLACGYRREGTLLVALDRDEADELVRLGRFQDRLGVSAMWLDPEQVQDLEPEISPRVTSALFAPHDHQVNPRALLAALERAVKIHGGRVITNAWVSGFDTHGGQLRRVIGRIRPAVPDPPTGPSAGARAMQHPGEAFAVRCQSAVLAAGAWSSRDLTWPAAPLGVRPVKGQLVRLRGPDLLRHVVRTPRVYLVPRQGGELIVGATMEEQGFDPARTAGAVMDLLWNARLVMPAVYDLEVVEVNVGFRPATRDHLPLIGATEVPGLYVATGHFRHGVLLAPATAALLADLIVEGHLDPMLLPFRPGRCYGARSPRHVQEQGRMTMITSEGNDGGEIAGELAEGSG